jgi:hypothetical protein
VILRGFPSLTRLVGYSNKSRVLIFATWSDVVELFMLGEVILVFVILPDLQLVKEILILLSSDEGLSRRKFLDYARFALLAAITVMAFKNFFPSFFPTRFETLLCNHFITTMVKARWLLVRYLTFPWTFGFFERHFVTLAL